MALKLGIKASIRLPAPDLQGTVTLESALSRRRSVRSFKPDPLSLTQIGQVLWAAQGITGERPYKRTSPSAGGRCPLEFYACWQEGVAKYDPENHVLVQHLDTDIRPRLPVLAWDQQFLATNGLVILIAAVFERTTQKYFERGQLRYVPMDVGHAAQNVLLQAVALGLGSVPVGAFDEAGIKALLQLPQEEEPMYMLPIGSPA